MNTAPVPELPGPGRAPGRGRRRVPPVPHRDPRAATRPRASRPPRAAASAPRGSGPAAAPTSPAGPTPRASLPTHGTTLKENAR